MGLNKFFQFFVTKETKFFPIYIKQSELISHATGTLLEMVKTDDYEKRKIMGRQIKKDETDGDNLFRDLYRKLNIAFITPFDREDVHDLGSNLDDFLDIIDSCSKNILMYNPQKIDSQLIEIADLLNKNSKLFIEIVKDLENIIKNSNKIIENCDKIKHTEHVIDDIYFNYISHLFKTETDYIELIKYKNIIETFEEASDIAKTISDTIRTIVIKKS